MHHHAMHISEARARLLVSIVHARSHARTPVARTGVRDTPGAAPTGTATQYAPVVRAAQGPEGKTMSWRCGGRTNAELVDNMVQAAIVRPSALPEFLPASLPACSCLSKEQ